MKSKILYNPLKQIFAVDLTKFPFVLYCLLENSYESNLRAFNYKNP
jgi:hypothetical protein